MSTCSRPKTAATSSAAAAEPQNRHPPPERTGASPLTWASTRGLSSVGGRLAAR